MPLGQNHMQPPNRRDTWTQLDICAPARHVRRHGDRPQLASLSHDLRLLFVIHRVQNLVRKALIAEQIAQTLRSFYRPGPDQYGAPLHV